MIAKYKIVATLVIVCAVLLTGIAYYEISRSSPAAGPAKSYWVIYTLTPSGNHTQIRTEYYNGNNYTNQIYWLDFNNKTAVYNYFKCTPSMLGCTLDGCSFQVLVNTATEYQVKTGDPCVG
jgi:amino acid transporter